MSLTAILLILTSMVSARTAPPELPVLEKHAFGSHDLVASANALLGLGEEEAVKLLLSRVTDWNQKKGFCTNERIGWLCRLIFEPKPIVAKEGAAAQKPKPIRQPFFGGLSLPHYTMPLSRWPKYPVAVQNDVPFVLAEGYMLAGVPEPPQKYIAHCRKHGRFRTKPYPVPTRASATKAVEAMFASERWQAIKWSHKSANSSYTISETWRQKEIRRQATRIPE